MSEFAIRRLSDEQQTPGLIEVLDEIFFEASNTKLFADASERAAFRDRWLGRYLREHATCTFLAVEPGGQVMGYVVGALDDPARDPSFADIAYFAAFSALTGLYPAHLHVNLAPEYRNCGVGSRLVQTFAEASKAAGRPGVHVVTSRGARNVSFYQRNGFAIRATHGLGSNEIVFLARDL